MPETRNNCFGSKKRSTTLLQAKTVKHECRNVTATLQLHFGTRAYLFSPHEGSCYIFSTRNNCCEFLASYGVFIQSVTQSFLKTPVCGASLTHLYRVFSRFKKEHGAASRKRILLEFLMAHF